MAAGTLKAVLAAHGLAWVAGIGLAVVPVYYGTVTTASVPGGPPGETVRHAETLMQANGVWNTLPLLLLPVFLTGAAVLVDGFVPVGRPVRRWLLWTPTIALLGFCALAIMTIGVVYLPAAAALLLGIALDPDGKELAQNHQNE